MYSTKNSLHVLMCPTLWQAVQGNKQDVKIMAPALIEPSSHGQATNNVVFISGLMKSSLAGSPQFDFHEQKRGHYFHDVKEETEAWRVEGPWEDSRSSCGSSPGFLIPDFMFFPLCHYSHQDSPTSASRSYDTVRQCSCITLTGCDKKSWQ